MVNRSSVWNRLLNFQAEKVKKEKMSALLQITKACLDLGWTTDKIYDASASVEEKEQTWGVNLDQRKPRCNPRCVENHNT